MKGKFTSFIAGVLSAVLIGSATIPALAASNAFNLTAYPIRVLINGEEFKPKDVKGNDALVFTYNGTTYAPLRALAEAYGLEVGYDGKQHLATVNSPSVSAPSATVSYENFASQWTVKEKPVTNYGSEKIFTMTYSGSLSMSEFKAWWKSMDESFIKSSAEQMAAEAQNLVPGYEVTAYFSYGQYSLGTAFALSGYQISNFDPAAVWIK